MASNEIKQSTEKERSGNEVTSDTNIESMASSADLPTKAADEKKADVSEAIEGDENLKDALTASETEASLSSLWSWSSSFLATAKQKSSEAYEFMKKDLSELKEVVKEDTTSAVSSTASYIRSAGLLVSSTLGLTEEEQNQIKVDGDKADNKEKAIEEGEDFKGKVDFEETENDDDLNAAMKMIEEKAKSVFFTLLDVFRGVDTIADDENQSEICVVVGDKMLQIPAERWNLLLSAIQKDPETYLHEPKGPPETYENWLEKFNLLDYQQQMENLQNSVSDIAHYYKKLVPTSISSDEFWHRYFYRVHQLLLVEEIRQQQQAQKEIDQQEPKIVEEVKIENTKTPEVVEIKKFNEIASPSSPPHSSSSSSSSVTKEKPAPLKGKKNVSKKAKSDLVIVNKEGSVTASETDENSSKTSDGSDGWEKTELNDIVDEASKRLTEKLKLNDDKQEEFGEEWDWQE